jgi:hypothetical protein
MKFREENYFRINGKPVTPMTVMMGLTPDEYLRLDMANKIAAPNASIEDVICMWATQELRDEKRDSQTLGLIRDELYKSKLHPFTRRFVCFAAIFNMVCLVIWTVAIIGSLLK